MKGSAPHFFIVSTGRSGTTLFRAMLTGSERIHIPPETGFVPTLLQLRHWWWRPGWGERHQARFVRLALSNGRLTRAGFDCRSIDQSELARATSPADAVRCLYEAMAPPGADLVGDKTPLYALHVRRLARAFPGAQFIHVVRDPRSTVASIASMPWGPDSIPAAAAHWTRVVLKVDRSFGQLPTWRRLTIRYEDLISDPQACLQLTCAFLDTPYSESMLEHRSRAARIQTEQKRPETHDRLGSGLIDEGWKSKLSCVELRLVEDVCSRGMQAHGYDLTREDSPGQKGVRRLHAKSAYLIYRVRLVLRSGHSRTRKLLHLVRRTLSGSSPAADPSP